MAEVTFDQMQNKLLPLDTVRAVLQRSEPLAEYPILVGSTNFSLDSAWNYGIDSLEDTDLVNATVTIGSREFPLTKDALFQATSAVGLPQAYVKRTPANLIEPQLNYWYGDGHGLGSKQLKMLVAGEAAAAVTKASINPFSTINILDEVLDGISARYGTGEVYADPKFHHNLTHTYLRLIIPSKTYEIQNTGTENDIWSMGVNVHNSLTGVGQTSLDGYLFRWWCTNGAIDTTASSGTWSRRSNGQDADTVYEWARNVVGDVLGTLEGSFPAIQEMAHTPIEGDTQHVLQDIFSRYKMSVKARDAVMANLRRSDDDLTMYALMQAITSVANLSDDPTEQNSLMRIGGDMPTTVTELCDSCHRVLS